MNQSIWFLGVLLILSVPSIAIQRYCELQDSQLKLFTTNKELQQIPLSKYIRGYNLKYESSNSSLVDIFQPYSVAEQANNTLPQDYYMLNFDQKNSRDQVFGRQAIVIGFDGKKNIALAYPEYKYDALPIIQNYSFYHLPEQSRCYSGRIINEKLDVVIDCQSADFTRDYSCIIPLGGDINCESSDSITASNQRRSVVVQLSHNKLFYITATLSEFINPAFKNQTYLTVYNIVNNKPIFNMIIDRRTLGLPSLAINDIDIVMRKGIKYIMLTDNNQGIITFRYLVQNKVADISVKKVGLPAKQSAVSLDEGIFVANDKYIQEYSSKYELVKKYELEASDVTMQDLQISPTLIMARTSSNTVYTYSRKHTQLRYLLSKQDVSMDTIVYVSPYFSRIFHINQQKMKSIAVSAGYILIADVQKAQTAQIIAKSDNITCKLNILIDSVQGQTKVYKKKQFKNTGYKFGAKDNIDIPLDNYFGGKKLTYKIKTPKEKDISYQIKNVDSYQRNQYQVNSNIRTEKQQVYRTQVLQIDSNSYYEIRFSLKLVQFFKCQLQSGQIKCKQSQLDQIVLPADSPKVTLSKTAYRSHSNEYIVAWVNQNQVIGIKNIGGRGFTMIFSGAAVRYSNIVISDAHIIFVQKYINMLEIYDGQQLRRINRKSFSPDDLNKLGGGFYPRDVLVNNENPNILYVKTPISVATMIYYGGESMQVLWINQVSDTFIPDQQWSILSGSSSFLLMTSASITEYSILPNSQIQKLHQLDLDNKKPLLPFQAAYSQTTNTAYVMTDDHSLQFIKLNLPKLESEYYQIPNISQNDATNWIVSGSWLILPSTNQIYYQNPRPVLNIATNNQQKDQETFDFDMQVSSSNQQGSAIEVKTKVTSINLKTNISQSSIEDNGLTLPSSANKTQIKFDIDQYFNGSVSKYELSCPFTVNKNLQLLPPFRKIKDNKNISGYSDIDNLPDNLGVVTIQNNVLTVINTQNTIQHSYIIEKAQGQCNNIGISNNDLAVLCLSQTTQQILTYTINGKQLTQSSHLFLDRQGFLIHPFDIKMYRKNSSSLYLLIHDADPLDPQSTISNVKMFMINNEQIEYLQTIDSLDFRTIQTQPINSISIKNNHLIMTVGVIGIGHIDFQTYPYSKSLINLQSVSEIQKFIFDDTLFLTVQIVAIDQKNKLMHVFVSTTNSIQFIFELKIGQTSLSYSSVLQRYNRYGNQMILNWVSIDEKIVLLSFYNDASSVQSIAFYRRPDKKSSNLITFFYASQFTIPYTQLHPPKSNLIYIGTIQSVSNLLFIQNRQIPSSQPSLSLYNVTGEFYLLANYQEPGNFDVLTVKASNAYKNQASREISIIFEGGDSSGLKWYAVVITICIVLLVVGISVGLYLRMKARKNDSKKVSLFTEEEETNERV